MDLRKGLIGVVLVGDDGIIICFYDNIARYFNVAQYWRIIRHL